MTIDCCKNSPSNYRTEADNNLIPTCYFSKKKDRLFNKFTASTLNPNNCDNLIFTIETTVKNNFKKRHLSHNLLIINNEGSQDENTENSHVGRNIKKKKKKKIREMNEIINNGVIKMEQRQERNHDFFHHDDANQKQQ